MAAWTLTLRQMQNVIATLYKTLTLKKGVTFTEMEIIRYSINEATQRFCEERGVDRWRFMQKEGQTSCVAEQAYIDLSTDVINVLAGTVRIESEEVPLAATSIESLTMADLDRDETGIPLLYALDTTATGGVRLQLYPIPDDTYVIDFSYEAIADEDSLSQFPAWTTGAIIDLATSIAMRRMGFGNPMVYEAAYEDAILNHANAQGYDGPLHINRAGSSGSSAAWTAGLVRAKTS